MRDDVITGGVEEPTLDQKVAFLSRSSAYGPSVTGALSRETHMSWVFLAGDRVYKLKKPVRFPYLDFSTLARREAACRAELDLNRRLAPDVYRTWCRWCDAARARDRWAGQRRRLARRHATPRRSPDARTCDHGAIVSTLAARRVVATLVQFYRRASAGLPFAGGPSPIGSKASPTTGAFCSIRARRSRRAWCVASIMLSASFLPGERDLLAHAFASAASSTATATCAPSISGSAIRSGSSIASNSIRACGRSIHSMRSRSVPRMRAARRRLGGRIHQRRVHARLARRAVRRAVRVLSLPPRDAAGASGHCASPGAQSAHAGQMAAPCPHLFAACGRRCKRLERTAQKTSRSVSGRPLVQSADRLRREAARGKIVDLVARAPAAAGKAGPHR